MQEQRLAPMPSPDDQWNRLRAAPGSPGSATGPATATDG
jgi:hypothetical protein